MTIYEEYAKAKQAISLLQDKLKDLEPKILEEIKVLSEPMRTEYGLFTTVTTEKWSFPDKTLEKVKEIMKEAKEKTQLIEENAIKNGEAELNELKSLRFIVKKGKND